MINMKYYLTIKFKTSQKTEIKQEENLIFKKPIKLEII